MKTNTIISAVLLSSVIALTACTPRDVKLGNGVGTNGRNGGSGTSDSMKLGSYSLAAVLASRQLEAIELIKVATGSADANVHQFTVTSKENKEGVQTLTVKPSDKKFEYSSAAGDWSVVTKRNFNVSFVKGELLESLTAEISNDPVCVVKGKEAPCRLAMNANSSQKSFYANYFDNTYSLTVSAGDSADQLKVVITSKGFIGGAKGGANENTDMEFESTMTIDKASLETDEVKIISSTLLAKYPSPQKDKTFTTTLKGSDLIAKISNQCSSLQGTYSAKAGSDFKLILTEDSLEIVGKGWKKDLAECGSRPTVDLSLLHL